MPMASDIIKNAQRVGSIRESYHIRDPTDTLNDLLIAPTVTVHKQWGNLLQLWITFNIDHMSDPFINESRVNCPRVVGTDLAGGLVLQVIGIHRDSRQCPCLSNHHRCTVVPRLYTTIIAHMIRNYFTHCRNGSIESGLLLYYRMSKV